MNTRLVASCLLLGGILLSCQPKSALDGLTLVSENPSDNPIRGISDEWLDRFELGDPLFEHAFFPSQGLGPLYIRPACSSCHGKDAKGPGAVSKMVVVEADGITASADQTLLPFGSTVRPLLAAGATSPLLAPESGVKKSVRIGPAVFGRGYLEAVADSEILRVQSEQAARGDAITGRVNYVTYHSQANLEQPFHAYVFGQTNVIGRFGVKARIATIDDFAADAFQGDMGLTSPMRTTELVNPDGLTDDLLAGVDLPLSTVNIVADYLRLLAIPPRGAASTSDEGKALFAQVQCSACHVPSMHTRVDYPIAQLADIDAEIYSDLLLHDLGDALADGLRDESATEREWKTAPLIGLNHLTSFLHDGRASDVASAIEHHASAGSEANASVEAFRALSASDRQTLIDFVSAL